MATPWEYALYVQGQTMILMWATLFWGLTTLVCVLLFLPPFGLLGACSAIAIARFGFASTTLRYATRVGCGLVLIPLKTAKRALIGVIVAAAIILILVSILKPGLLSLPNKLWFKLGIMLGSVVAPLVMGLVYFTTVVPIGLIMKLMGKDLLHKKLDRGAKSYWIERSQPVESMKNQF